MELALQFGANKRSSRRALAKDTCTIERYTQRRVVNSAVSDVNKPSRLRARRRDSSLGSALRPLAQHENSTRKGFTQNPAPAKPEVVQQEALEPVGRRSHHLDPCSQVSAKLLHSMAKSPLMNWGALLSGFSCRTLKSRGFGTHSGLNFVESSCPFFTSSNRRVILEAL